MAAKTTNNYQSLAKGAIQKPVVQGSDAAQHTVNIGSTVAPTSIPDISAPKGTALTNAVNNRNYENLAKNNVAGDPKGNISLGTPKVYDSVGEAGSGFVNMSHLLGLNKGSGEKSALDYAGKTKAAGEAAMSGIKSAEDRFTGAAKEGMAGWQFGNHFDVGEGGQGQIDKARKAEYTGPNDMSSMGGYADLSKKVSDAQEQAKNSQTGYGMAAQVNKDTGLSPIQSAASAFYMGVNNPNIKRAGSAFTNLQGVLDKANQRAMDSARWARGEASRTRDAAEGWQKELNDWNTQPKALTGPEKVAQSEQQAADANARTQERHNGRNEADQRAVDEAYRGIKMGMPSEIAYQGITYEQWVEMGEPTWEEYQGGNHLPGGN